MEKPKTYRDHCHVEGCETVFLGVKVDEYINHLQEEHGELKANIAEKCLVGICDHHGEYELEGYGRCPNCEHS